MLFDKRGTEFVKFYSHNFVDFMGDAAI